VCCQRELLRGEQTGCVIVRSKRSKQRKKGDTLLGVGTKQLEHVHTYD
jgi:hypothetical protein